MDDFWSIGQFESITIKLGLLSFLKKEDNDFFIKIYKELVDYRYDYFPQEGEGIYNLKSNDTWFINLIGDRKYKCDSDEIVEEKILVKGCCKNNRGRKPTLGEIKEDFCNGIVQIPFIERFHAEEFVSLFDYKIKEFRDRLFNYHDSRIKLY